MMNRYMIVGNGVAGTTAAEHLRKQDENGTVTIVTDEDLPFYWRVRLNEYIAGETDEKALVAKKEAWYRDRDIELRLNTRITGGDVQRKVLISDEREEFPYDKLLIATGSYAFIPPIKGSDKEGVFALRAIHDARKISAWAQKAKNVVLIGGGLLGLETGNALIKRGLKVTVVEFFPRLLPRQLDGAGAAMLQGMMESMGFSFRLGAKTQEIRGQARGTGVLLEGGESLPAEMVVISAGVRPHMELSEPLGLETDKGIKVDEHLCTNQPDIYAAGDVAQFGPMPYGIWSAGAEQGEVAGINMAGGNAVYHGSTMSTTLKVAGIDLAAAGEIDAENKFESRVTKEKDSYRKIVLDNDRIIGCIMLGDKTGYHQVTELMSEKRDVSQVKDQILSKGFDFSKL